LPQLLLSKGRPIRRLRLLLLINLFSAFDFSLQIVTVGSQAIKVGFGLGQLLGFSLLIILNRVA